MEAPLPKVSCAAAYETGVAPKLDSEDISSTPLPTVTTPEKAELSPDSVQVPTPSLKSGRAPEICPLSTPSPAPPNTKALLPLPVKLMLPLTVRRPASEVKRARNVLSVPVSRETLPVQKLLPEAFTSAALPVVSEVTVRASDSPVTVMPPWRRRLEAPLAPPVTVVPAAEVPRAVALPTERMPCETVVAPV